MAAPVWQSASVDVTSAAGATLVTTLPSGTASGDLLVLVISADDADTYSSGLGTWTQLDTGVSTTGTNPTRGYIFWKIAGPSEAAPTVTMSGSGAHSWSMHRITGSDATTPFSTGTKTEESAAATNHTMPAITPPTADNLLFGVVAAGTGTGTYAAEGTYTERAEITLTGGHNHVAATKALTGGAGVSTGTTVWTTSLSRSAVLFHTAIQPVQINGFTLPLIASTATVHTPTLKQRVNIGPINNVTTMHTPQMHMRVTLPHLASTAVVHALGISKEGTVTLPHIASTATVHTPTLRVGLALPHIASTATLHAPTLIQRLVLPHIASDSEIYQPEIWNTTAVLSRVELPTPPPVGLAVARVVATNVTGTLTVKANPATGAGSIAAAEDDEIFLRGSYRILTSTAGSHTISLRAAFYDGGGSLLSTALADNDLNVGSGTTFREIVGRVTAPASTATVVWRLVFDPTGPRENLTVDMDRAQVVVNPGEDNPAYFDGDQLNGQWTGTDHLSTSEELTIPTGLRFVWDGEVRGGKRTVFAAESDFGVLAADGTTPIDLGGAGLRYPRRAAALEGSLFIGTGVVYGGSRETADYSTGTVAVTEDSNIITGTGTSWLGNVDEGMMFKLDAANSRYYIVAQVNSDTELVLSQPYEGADDTGEAYGVTRLASVSAGGTAYPEAAEVYFVCANRMVSCKDNRINFSAILDPHSWDLSEPGYHLLPDGVEIIGGESIEQRALLFTTGGMWVLDGLALDKYDFAGNVQHRMRKSDPSMILWGNAGMAFYRSSLVVPALDGIWLVDGISAPQPVSASATERYLGHVRDGNRPGLAEVFNSHYFLPVLNPSNEVVDLLVFRIDRPVATRGQTVFPWTRFEGHGGKAAALASKVRTGTERPQLLAADNTPTARVVDLAPCFEPSSENKMDGDGSTPYFEIVTRDYPTGQLTRNVVKRTRLRYEMNGDDAFIDADWSEGKKVEDVVEWGETMWGASTWYDSSNAEFNVLEGQAPVDDEGTQPHVWRVNQRSRFQRYRFRCDDPVEKLIVRSLEVFIRPSQTARH